MPKRKIEKNDSRKIQKDVWKYLLYSIISFIILFILGEMIFSDEKRMDYIRAPLYDNAQNLIWLKSSINEEDLPVIVDISGIEMVDCSPYVDYKITSTKKLEELLTTLQNMGVKAIGVDVDLGPINRGNIIFEPPLYTNLWNNLADAKLYHIPIVIGVDNIPKDQYNTPLSRDPRLSKLVGLIRVPDNFKGEYNMFTSLSEDIDIRIESLGYRLASLSDSNINTRYLNNQWYRDYYRDEKDHNDGQSAFNHRRVLLDYSLVNFYKSPDAESDTFDPLIIKYKDFNFAKPGPDGDEDRKILEPHLKGHTVIVGRYSDPSGWDYFRVPGQQVPRPGIMLHAAAVYNFQHPNIIPSVLNRNGSLAVDIFLLLILILGTVLISRKMPIDTADKMAKPVLKLLFVIGLFIVFFLMTYRFRIIWDDLLLFLAIQIFDEPISLIINFIGSRIYKN